MHAEGYVDVTLNIHCKLVIAIVGYHRTAKGAESYGAVSSPLHILQAFHTGIISMHHNLKKHANGEESYVAVAFCKRCRPIILAK